MNDNKAELTAKDPAPRAPKSFIQTMAELQFGHFQDECTERMREAIIATAKTEKVSEVVLRIKMKPGKGGQVEISSTVDNKLPKEEKGTSIMFISPEFNLQRSDPRQQELTGMRVVDTGNTGGGVRADDEQQPTVAAVRVG
jgi:hypothetical protein